MSLAEVRSSIPTPRPRYESDGDRRNEEEIASSIARLWGFEARKLPMQYRIDFALLTGRSVDAFLEVKARRNPSTAYRTLILSSSKYEAALAYRRTFGTPVFLAIRWTDRLGVCLLEPARMLRLTLGGRTDRPDWQDVEPCVELDVAAFVDPSALVPSGAA